MACLNSDGTLTVVAGSILKALATAGDPADVAATTGLPLYRVRSGLRELVQAGIVEVIGETYGLTARGNQLVGEARQV